MCRILCVLLLLWITYWVSINTESFDTKVYSMDNINKYTITNVDIKDKIDGTYSAFVDVFSIYPPSTENQSPEMKNNKQTSKNTYLSQFRSIITADKNTNESLVEEQTKEDSEVIDPLNSFKFTRNDSIQNLLLTESQNELLLQERNQKQSMFV